MAEPSLQKCAACLGTGDAPGHGRCEACDGQSQVLVHPPYVKCPHCKGAGRAQADDFPRGLHCVVCQGRGWALSLIVPAAQRSDLGNLTHPDRRQMCAELVRAVKKITEERGLPLAILQADDGLRFWAENIGEPIILLAAWGDPERGVFGYRYENDTARFFDIQENEGQYWLIHDGRPIGLMDAALTVLRRYMSIS
jgi:hypothetical protein